MNLSACPSPRLTKLAILFSILLAFRFSGFGQRPVALRGFNSTAVPAELRWETMLSSATSPASLAASLRTLTRLPHVASTPADQQTASYVASVFRQAGLRTEVIPYSARLSFPRLVHVTLLPAQGAAQRLPNYETPVPGDPYSGDRTALVGFNAYSASGTVTAPVVYANYGLGRDYATLQRAGIQVRGKIVLVRYGESYRGNKAALAQRMGAAGVLLYSDPNDDGYHAGDTYPKGSYRPPYGIQRGSILNNSYPGAPLHPGERPAAAEISAWNQQLPRIPVAPIAYAAASPILQALQGAAAPADWQGGLPFTYHFGGGAAPRLRLHVEMTAPYATIWDVIGTIPGTSSSTIIMGNHRDAWTFGAVDPGSGTAVLLQTARNLGKLLQAGWRPRRTIELASWDGEEFGLIGSTDYANQFRQALRDSAAVYLNVDEGVGGTAFTPASVPSLRAELREVARDVQAPSRAGRTSFLSAAWLQDAQDDARRQHHPLPLRAPVDDLGGGSDFESLLCHDGIASADISFSGSYGVYHSLYDDFHYYDTVIDPGFLYSQTETNYMGRLLLRLADAPLLPLDLPTYAARISQYVSQLRAASPQAPARQLPWAATLRAAIDLQNAAGEFNTRAQNALQTASINPQRLRTYNRALREFEGNLLGEGLPQRPYFLHMIYAPELTRGYDPSRLPGLSEALKAHDWASASGQLQQLTALLQDATAALQAAR